MSECNIDFYFYLQQLSPGDDYLQLLLSILLVLLFSQGLQLLQRFGRTEGEGATSGTYLSLRIHVYELILHSAGAGQVRCCTRYTDVYEYAVLIVYYYLLFFIK